MPRRLLLIPLLMLAACAPEARVLFADVDPGGWEQPAQVRFENTDTLARHTLSIVIRHNAACRQHSLPLRITVTAPDSTQFTECFTAGISGERRPASLHSESATPYRRRVRFDKTGIYRMTFECTDDAVRGVEAIGLRIEND